ncbi:MAG: hypothetical protein PHE83_17610 [Opitutaceae bacterium]|nr:hypothetical protein [Opitutaceae bacterium]
MSPEAQSLPPAIHGRDLPESRICAAAVAKLRSGGWQVACEVPFWERSIDAVGVNERDELFAIEAKTCFSKRVISQAWGAQSHVEYVVIAVGTRPRDQNLELARQHGLGVWRVDDSGTVQVLLGPVRQEMRPGDFYRTRLRESVRQMDGSVPGGMPCLDGVGPTADLQRRVDEFKAANPKATWKVIFAQVPNHFTSARNMYSALRANRERKSLRRRLRESKLRREAECGAGI